MAQRFLIHSASGNFLPGALRLAREGHAVRLYIDKPRARNVGKGLISKTPRFDPRKGEIILFDMVGFGTLADRLRSQGFLVIGASAYCDKIELDREAGIDLMRRVGIPVPETHGFNNVVEAQAFLSNGKNSGEWFFKPSGNLDTSLTFGAPDVESMQRFLSYASTVRPTPKRCLLQRKVEGLELSLEGWFDGNDFIYPFNSTLEDKRFLTGDLGPNIGSAANLVWCYEEPQPKLALKTLWRIAPFLRKAKYVGPIDINLIIEADGTPRGLEWTPRFGFDAFWNLAALIPGDLGDQLNDFAMGNLPAWQIRRSRFAMSLRISSLPFPSVTPDNHKGMPLPKGIIEDPLRVLPYDVALDAKGKPEFAGSDACIAVVVETGLDVGVMRRSLVETARNLHVPDGQFRTDPVERFESAMASLKGWGYDQPAALDFQVEERKPYEIEPNAKGEADGVRAAGSGIGPQDADRNLLSTSTPVPDVDFTPRLTP